MIICSFVIVSYQVPRDAKTWLNALNLQLFNSQFGVHFRGGGGGGISCPKLSGGFFSVRFSPKPQNLIKNVSEKVRNWIRSEGLRLWTYLWEKYPLSTGHELDVFITSLSKSRRICLSQPNAAPNSTQIGIWIVSTT